MNLWQAVKMAWKSIWGKKGRSALTILGIFIGIAAVMTIVSVMDGYKRAMTAQYSAMGTGIINVSIYNWMYDEQGFKGLLPRTASLLQLPERRKGRLPAGQALQCDRLLQHEKHREYAPGVRRQRQLGRGSAAGHVLRKRPVQRL